MQDFERILLSQMKDIHGLTRVSPWPPATGWWLLSFILLVIIFIAITKVIKIHKHRKSWRYALEKELDKIAVDDDISKAKQNISRINEILKRFAIYLYGREQTASLVGKKWLIWLSNRDPNHYNWLKKGKVLTNYPYMPEENVKADQKNIKSLARAAKQWMKLEK